MFVSARLDSEIKQHIKNAVPIISDYNKIIANIDKNIFQIFSYEDLNGSGVVIAEYNKTYTEIYIVALSGYGTLKMLNGLFNYAQSIKYNIKFMTNKKSIPKLLCRFKPRLIGYDSGYKVFRIYTG